MMRAAALFPDKQELRIIEVEEPQITVRTQVKLRVLDVGICGTDRELCAFVHGTPPAGSPHMILGHEALAEVIETGPDVELRPGDLVVPAVRLPCEEATCQACRMGHQDFCASGLYIEHGIAGLHGFMTETFVAEERYLFRVPQALREVGVLVEPLTIAEKAYREFCAVQMRLPWQGDRTHVLVLGAGTVGLLGAMKFRLAGYEVWMYSREPASSPNAQLAVSIGARYISSSTTAVGELAEGMGSVDVVYEALGAAPVSLDVLKHLSPNGVYLFTGVPRREKLFTLDAPEFLRNLVLKNQAVVGVVNAGAQAFKDSIEDLNAFLQQWPSAVNAMITRRYSLDEIHTAICQQEGNIKQVVTFRQEQHG